MTVPVEGPPASAQVLEYATLLRSLDPVAIGNEYRAVLRARRGAPTSISSLQLALLLSHRDSPYYDLDEAIVMLNQIMDGGEADPELRGLTSLLLMLLDERRRVVADRGDLATRALSFDRAPVEEPLVGGSADPLVSSDAEETPDTESANSEALEIRVQALLAELEEERERGRRLEAQVRGLIELEEQLSQEPVAVGDE